MHKKFLKTYRELIISFSSLFVFFLSHQVIIAQTTRFIATGDSRGATVGVNTAILSEIVQATINENADFIPKQMTVEQFQQGTKWLLYNLYDPDNFYGRFSLRIY